MSITTADSVLADIFHANVAASFDKQLHLADLVDNLDWHFDMASGRLSFGNSFHWRAQILGTESESAGTWLWAWANQASNIPQGLLEAAQTMKAFGEQHQVRQFTEPEVSLAEIDGHAIALIASGICRADAYYRGPYDGGAAFLLIKDDSFPRNTEPPVSRIVTVFPQAISALEIPNHRLTLLAYLASKGLLGWNDGTRLVVGDRESPALTATFDNHNRLINLEAAIESNED